MDNMTPLKTVLVKSSLWGAMLLSTLALVYHIRWFLHFLLNSASHHVPSGQSPIVWFTAQILSNLIFLFAAYLLTRLFDRYQQLGFFDQESLKVFDSMMTSCLCLGLLGFIKLAFSDFHPLPLSEYNSLWGAANLVSFLIVDTATFKDPQTMYFLLTLLLWGVKQFVIRALSIKSENEGFI